MCEQMKTIMRHYLILVRMGVIRNKIKVTNAVKYIEKREPFHTIDRNSNYYSHYIEKGGYLTKNPNPEYKCERNDINLSKNTLTPTFISAHNIKKLM